MMENTTSHSQNFAWDPCVLGMRKHKLLREDILPAMASNRKVQRLLDEFMDLISEYENVETNIERRYHSSPTEIAPALTDSSPRDANQMISVPAVTDQVKSVQASTDLVDSSQEAVDLENSAPVAKDKFDSDQPPPVNDQVSLSSQDADS